MIKEFKTNLIVDYKNGNFKCYKKVPKNLKASEIPIKVTINIEIPEKPEVIATGNIKLSDEKIQEMVIEEI